MKDNSPHLDDDITRVARRRIVRLFGLGNVVADAAFLSVRPSNQVQRLNQLGRRCYDIVNYVAWSDDSHRFGKSRHRPGMGKSIRV